MRTLLARCTGRGCGCALARSLCAVCRSARSDWLPGERWRGGLMGRDRRIWMLVIAAAVIVVDRLTKRWVGAHLGLGQAIVVIPRVFRITHVLNTGAAF